MDSNTLDLASTAIDFTALLLLAVIWFRMVRFLELRKHRDPVYLLFFTMFYVYLVKVLDYTLFQFQTLLLLRYLKPDLILQGQATGHELNLVPLVTLTARDVGTSLLNILLLIPFGLALPLITDLRMPKVVAIGALFSITIEILQLLTGWAGGMTFRVADINDVIFNTIGAAIGYALFVASVLICRRAPHSLRLSPNPIVRYFAQRPQLG